MADQLATPTQLASLLQSDLDAATADVVLNAATAVVQGAARQRLVLVDDDVIEMIGTTDSWLWLPQRPVVDVTLVELDGVEIEFGDDLKLFGGTAGRMWRRCGWAACAYAPSTVAVTYTHGYAAGHQDLELARSATLGLAAVPYNNPSGASSVKIDDYAEAYSVISARMEASPGLKAALRRQYGRRSGLVRIG